MSKQKTITGTKPTFTQRVLLERNNKIPDEWNFVKEVVKENDNTSGKKSLSRSSNKTVYLEFVNKTTGEVISLERNNYR